MLTDAKHVVAGIFQEHRVVVGIRSIDGVGEPEILPNHDAVAVASLVKFAVARLSDPISDAIQVHFAMVAHRRVVFATAIAKVVLRKAPVAAEWHESLSVHEDLQARINFGVGHFADTCLIGDS